MPSYEKLFRNWLLACLFMTWPFPTQAEDYRAKIVEIDVTTDASSLDIDANIEYQLSPTARDALLKGIPMTWHVEIQLRQPGLIWDTVVATTVLPFRLKFHALLNQYEVLTPQGHEEMFLTLNAAIDFMSSLHDWATIDRSLLSDSNLVLAIKSRFIREHLPVPLRPFTYLDSQWSLSSDWFLWPLTK